VEVPATTFVAGFLDPSFGIAVGHRGAAQVTTDGGSTWSDAERRTTARRFGLEIVDTRTAWNCGNSGHVLATQDGGQTWKAVRSFGPDGPDHCRFLSFLDGETGWAATPHQLGATGDGGESWREVVLPGTIGDIAAIALRAPDDGYVLDAGGGLYATADGGETWLAGSLGLEPDQMLLTSTAPMAALRFIDPERGIAVIQESGAEGRTWSLLTADAGATWQWVPIPEAPGQTPLFLSPDGTMLTLLDGTEALVLRYDGPTWMRTE
jgi:photosystem II stability/assembly factor-like uncharacterized protein